MKIDSLKVAADATAVYLHELALKGTTVVTWDDLDDYLRSAKIAEQPGAVALMLVHRNLLRPHERPTPQPSPPMSRGTFGGSANAGFFAFGGAVIRDSGPTAWDILSSIFDPKSFAAKDSKKRGPQTVEVKGGDRATVYKIIRRLHDEGISREEIKNTNAKDVIADFIQKNPLTKTNRKRQPDDVIRAALR